MFEILTSTSSLLFVEVLIQGQQGQEKLKRNSLIIQHRALKYGNVPLNHQKWLPYQILGDKNCKEHTNRSTNNGDVDERAKRLRVSL